MDATNEEFLKEAENMGEMIEELHSAQNQLKQQENRIGSMEDGLRDLGFTPSLIEDLKQGKPLTGVSIEFTDPPVSPSKTD